MTASDQPPDPDSYASWHSTPHRDSQVVAVDVARSLWTYLAGANDAQLQERRGQLQQLINAAVGFHAGTVGGRARVYFIK